MSSFIEFKKFSFKYDAQAEPTLKEIDLTIEKGQKVLIMGPSGSGKSTLAQCLNGIIPNIYSGKQTGELCISGENVYDVSVYDKSHLVSTVLQDLDGQFIGLTVAEDLAFALENDCIKNDQMKEQIAVWSEKLHLSSLLSHRPQDLSGGQKQRISLAGVLIDESPILLFDEPLANLDPKSGQETIDLIDQIHHETDVTTIIIEHRLEDILYRSVDKIVLMNDGRIIFDGSPDQLLATPLLKENGIREPLYITVLKKFGVQLEPLEHLSQLDNIDLPSIVFQEDGLDYFSSGSKELLKASHLNFSYQEGDPILKDISLTIYQGERLAFVGKNGAGKSTLVKALCGFIKPEGEIYYQGKPVTTESITSRARKVGYVLQNPNQMISQTMIYDEVAIGLRYKGIAEEEIAKRVDKVLQICGLYPFRKWPISALSFGQKKRVTIASVLALEPEVIILDEPTAGQDEKNYSEMLDFLDELNALGHTIIMVTHDMQLLLEYSDRVVVIDDGKILADLAPEELFSQETILEQANLKKTSLYQLAEKLAIDPIALTKYYIREQRGKV